MPRILRGLTGNQYYHLLNRGNGGQVAFHEGEDFCAFLDLIEMACKRYPVQLYSFCVLPNHFHLLVKPEKGEDLSRWMQWLTTSHVRRYHKKHASSGHVWQGRYKSFLVKDDEHLLAVARCIERNPVAVGLVTSANDWRWSSHGVRIGDRGYGVALAPLLLPNGWTDMVDQPIAAQEFDRWSQSLKRQRPYGDESWQMDVCEQHGLESTMKNRGRPRRG